MVEAAETAPAMLMMVAVANNDITMVMMMALCLQ